MTEKWTKQERGEKVTYTANGEEGVGFVYSREVEGSPVKEIVSDGKKRTHQEIEELFK